MPHGDNPFEELTEKAVLAELGVIENDWRRRWDKVRDWRDLRYGRTDVISSIPANLRATDYEHHSPELDTGILNLASFLSAAVLTMSAKPPKDRDRTKAEKVESLLEAVFGANGVLETESGGEVGFTVWQNQVENGSGIYKMLLKRNYPLRVPQRRYVDELDGLSIEDFEVNESRRPKSKRTKKDGAFQTDRRETDESLDRRREEFSEQEFAWMWRSVDVRTYFEITVDDVPIAAGEIAARPASLLNDHGLEHLNIKDGDYAYLEAATPRSGGGVGGQRTVVDTIEFWTQTEGMFGFLAHTNENFSSRKDIALGDAGLSRWKHPYGRVPYYHAYGLPSTDADRAWKYTGAFNAMIAELPLLNLLETLHYNAIHRGYAPVYYPVEIGSSGEMQPLDNMEQLTGVQFADTERAQLPPGWKWEIMPSGFEPDLSFQLQGSRDRIEKSAIAAVLTGTSPGSADSGAKISLLINAASRALSPFVRHHEAPLKEMAEVMLRVSKALGIDLHVSEAKSTSAVGETFIEPLTVKARDIVTTAIDVRFDMALPVDRAAMEVRGITLMDAGKISYEKGAPEFFNVGDPVREKRRIRVEQRSKQMDDVTFGMALKRLQETEPAEFAEFMGQVQPVPPDSGNVGGGPAGSRGGADALIGRGDVASPGATQIDS